MTQNGDHGRKANSNILMFQNIREPLPEMGAPSFLIHVGLLDLANKNI